MRRSLIAMVLLAAGVSFATAQTTEKTQKAKTGKVVKAETAQAIKADTTTPQPAIQADATLNATDAAAIKTDTAAELKPADAVRKEDTTKVEAQ